MLLSTNYILTCLQVVLNNRLPPPPPPSRADEPSNAESTTAPVLDSSSDSSDSYNGDDAWCFLQEWRAAKDHYSEATQENYQLEICLKASQATLLATEEETNIARAWLAKSSAMVAGKMDSKKTFVHIFSTIVLTVSLFL